jgi:PHD/YefM family antitoxin component YafN of YafNO toxin-antitoxin module
MKFLSTRELRNRPGFVRELARKEDLVLTANGKPIAMLLGVEEDELEETARVIRQARAQRALSRMRRQSSRRGLETVSPLAIEAEIRAVRSKRKPGSKRKPSSGRK